MGLMLRQDFNNLKEELIRKGRLYEDPDFPAYSSSIYLSRSVSNSVKWTRPGQIVRDPKFMIEGATRSDLDQGQLGDCWFIAAAATLISSNKKLFYRVVPKDQSFEEGKYAGIFRFNFWRFGKWVEVIIDDRLPTVWGEHLMFASNVEQPNEFWSALLEKAFAKLHGTYEAIEGGHTQDALIDMTGGIGEVIDLRNKGAIPSDLFDTIYKTYHMNSLMGVSIPAQRISSGGEGRLSNGIYTGHAYSITGILKATFAGKDQQLIRLRNPWGKKEWNGPWSDNSAEWKSIAESDRKRFGMVFEDDGEFWMSFHHMVSIFSEISFCHLSPDALTKEIAHDIKTRPWLVSSYNSEWVRGVSAGGCGNPPHQDLYWTNPQFHVELKEPDSDNTDGLCTLITSLMEKEDKSKDRQLAIGLDVFMIRKNVHSELLNGRNLDLKALTVLKRTDTYVHNRQFCHRLRLEPGNYVLMASTFQPGAEAEFLLRIYTQNHTPSASLDEPTGPIKLEKPIEEKETVYSLFKRYAGVDSSVDAKELTDLLNDHFKKDVSDGGFSVETARMIMPLMNLDGSGVLTFPEVDKMIKETSALRDMFYKVDTNKSGTVDAYELSTLFKMTGFSISRRILGKIVTRYGGKKRQLTFQDVAVCVSRVMVMFTLFQNNVPEGKQKAEMSLEEWMMVTMYH